MQASEKTEAGNQSMHVDMVTTTATTFLGSGDLSWQAINWSTPNALDLWFNLAAADYALKTEQDAGQVITDAGFDYVIGSALGATPTFADFLTAVGAGASEVFENSGREADTLYLATDLFWYVFGLTSNAFAQFAAVSEGGIGPLNIVRTVRVAWTPERGSSATRRRCSSRRRMVRRSSSVSSSRRSAGSRSGSSARSRLSSSTRARSR